MDAIPQRRQSRANDIGHAGCLDNQSTQFCEYGCGRVGLIVLLPAHALDRNESRRGELCELTLYGTGPCASQGDHFAREETAVRVAEQDAQHALLCFREERVSQAGWSLVRRPVSGFLLSHFGYDKPQYGKLQYTMPREGISHGQYRTRFPAIY